MPMTMTFGMTRELIAARETEARNKIKQTNPFWCKKNKADMVEINNDFNF